MAGKKEQKEKKDKPLDKWTMKELREEALTIPNIQGVHGMNKEEIIAALRVAKGISEPESKKKGGSVREIKAKVADMKKQREEERAQGASRNRLDILRKKISRLKRQTRA